MLTAVETVAAAHVRWLWGWDRKQDDPPFDLRAIQGEFYDWEADDVLGKTLAALMDSLPGSDS
ncbi:hypothetical protein ACFWF7_38970 [Nocardia sp. NPDC060256]|uniref:hypothetical protein n=1 Tax=unclassified Nocardia TaxID=2637762 RepID=UPI00365FCB55